MLCKCKWFANKTPSLVQNVSNKQIVKKYQMWIIFISTRSWAWRWVEKLNYEAASLRYLQWEVQTPCPVQCGFSNFHYARIFSLLKKFYSFKDFPPVFEAFFQFISNFPQEYFIITQWKSNCNSVKSSIIFSKN